MVRTNQSAEVVIDERRIRGTIKDKNQTFETTRIEDPRLLEELEQHDVKFTGETQTNGWSNLTGWLLPLVVSPGRSPAAFSAG